MADEKENEVTNEELDKYAKEGEAKGKTSEPIIDKTKEEEKAKADLAEAEKLKLETEAKLKEEEKKKEEELEPAERSRLGRKVKGLEAERVTLINDISDLKQKVDQLLSGKVTTQTDTINNEDDDTPVSRKEIPILLQKEKDKERQVVQTAEAKFIKKVMELAGDEEDEALISEITKEMDDNGLNKFGFINPEVDAVTNYLKAKNSVLMRQNTALKTGKKNPLDKNRETAEEKPATGVSGGDKVNTKKAEMPKLDKDAEEAIAMWGMKPEDALDALTGESNSLIIKGRG